MDYQHIPVLLEEVINILNPKEGENFVDATLGGGGYSGKILNKIGLSGKLLSVDLDQEALKKAEEEKAKNNFSNWILVHGNFAQIDKHITAHNFKNISGIVADLGLSSYELEHRGISFQVKQPLDMRFNLSQHETAEFILQAYDEKRLTKIFKDYGEEKFSPQIAKKIVHHRQETGPIKYTTELYGIIEAALPKPIKHKAQDHARRIFQALRIEVNQELQSLEEFLPKAFNVLAPGGKLAVVSFHSLEDRIVKQYFQALGKGCVCPPDFPQCVCGKNPQAKIVTKKPVIASETEAKENPRSLPAKLRAIIKL